MGSRYQRKPRDYDGTERTTHGLGELLPVVLHKVHATYQERPDLILASWPDVIGKKLAAMTQATAFTDGVLTVLVKNSTLHSLLNQHEKQHVLLKLRNKFPSTPIKTIVFRIG